MTKEQIEKILVSLHLLYNIDSEGLCKDTKFFNEPIYVAYYYDHWINGFEDSFVIDNSTMYSIFNITDEDKEIFTELLPYGKLIMWETNDGYIRHELKRTYNKKIK